MFRSLFFLGVTPATKGRHEDHTRAHRSRARHARRADNPDWAERRLAGVRRHDRQHALLDLEPDHAGECRDAPGGLDVRDARRVQGLGDADEPRRDRRRAVWHEPQAARLCARCRDRRGVVELRSELREKGPEPVPAPRTRRHRRPRPRDVSKQVVRARSQDRSADPVVRRQQRIRRHAQRVRSAGGAHHRECEHPGGRLRRPVHHRQHGGRSTAVVAGRHPRLRRQNRRVAMGLSHHSASRRVRIRHLAAGCVEGVGRRQCLVRRHDRSDARDRLCRHRLGGLRLLWREPDWRQLVREHAARARRQDRQSGSGISRR